MTRIVTSFLLLVGFMMVFYSHDAAASFPKDGTDTDGSYKSLVSSCYNDFDGDERAFTQCLSDAGALQGDSTEENTCYGNVSAQKLASLSEKTNAFLSCMNVTSGGSASFVSGYDKTVQACYDKGVVNAREMVECLNASAALQGDMKGTAETVCYDDVSGQRLGDTTAMTVAFMSCMNITATDPGSGGGSGGGGSGGGTDDGSGGGSGGSGDGSGGGSGGGAGGVSTQPGWSGLSEAEREAKKALLQQRRDAAPADVKARQAAQRAAREAVVNASQ